MGSGWGYIYICMYVYIYIYIKHEIYGGLWVLQQANASHDDTKWYPNLPSGKHTKNYGKSQFSMGKSTISMAIFNSYVSLPEGIAFLMRKLVCCKEPIFLSLSMVNHVMIVHGWLSRKPALISNGGRNFWAKTERYIEAHHHAHRHAYTPIYIYIYIYI